MAAAVARIASDSVPGPRKLNLILYVPLNPLHVASRKSSPQCGAFVRNSMTSIIMVPG